MGPLARPTHLRRALRQVSRQCGRWGVVVGVVVVRGRPWPLCVPRCSTTRLLEHATRSRRAAAGTSSLTHARAAPLPPPPPRPASPAQASAGALPAHVPAAVPPRALPALPTARGRVLLLRQSPAQAALRQQRVFLQVRRCGVCGVCGVCGGCGGCCVCGGCGVCESTHRPERASFRAATRAQRAPLPVAGCRSVCGRRLACSHSCPEVCHPGACPPCQVVRRTDRRGRPLGCRLRWCCRAAPCSMLHGRHAASMLPCFHACFHPCFHAALHGPLRPHGCWHNQPHTLENAANLRAAGRHARVCLWCTERVAALLQGRVAL
jgi:hypothetical protein